MEIVLTCTIFGVFLCIAFLLGAKVGQKVSSNQEIKLPTLNPAKKVKEMLKDKENKKEEERMETILQNIENYDGTEIGQLEVKIK